MYLLICLAFCSDCTKVIANRNCRGGIPGTAVAASAVPLSGWPALLYHLYLFEIKIIWKVENCFHYQRLKIPQSNFNSAWCILGNYNRILNMFKMIKIRSIFGDPLCVVLYYYLIGVIQIR